MHVLFACPFIKFFFVLFFPVINMYRRQGCEDGRVFLRHIMTSIRCMTQCFADLLDLACSAPKIRSTGMVPWSSLTKRTT